MTMTMSTACWRGDCANCYGEIEPGVACDCPACHVSIYPVGLLRDLRHAVSMLRRRQWRYAWRKLCATPRYVAYQVRAGDWRAVSNTFNGYLAEHATIGCRAGIGWTKRRALADLHQHLREETTR